MRNKFRPIAFCVYGNPIFPNKASATLKLFLKNIHMEGKNVFFDQFWHKKCKTNKLIPNLPQLFFRPLFLTLFVGLSKHAHAS